MKLNIAMGFGIFLLLPLFYGLTRVASAMRVGSPIPKSSSRSRRSPWSGRTPQQKRARRSSSRGRASQIVLPTFEEGDELEEESIQIDDQRGSDDDTLQKDQETVVT